MGQIFTTIPPPIFLPRFVVGLPILYIFISFGIIYATKILHKLRLNSYHVDILILLIVLILSFYNFSLYFFSYAKQIDGDPNARAATKISFILNNYYKNYTAYFYTSPRLYADFGTLRFLSGETNKVNLNTNNGIYTSSTIKSIYIIYPEYVDITQKLYEKFPEGKINELRDIDGSIQFYTFVP
jgi:hypothetical protein